LDFGFWIGKGLQGFFEIAKSGSSELSMLN
jgi:hypothetical protein